MKKRSNLHTSTSSLEDRRRMWTNADQKILSDFIELRLKLLSVKLQFRLNFSLTHQTAFGEFSLQNEDRQMPSIWQIDEIISHNSSSDRMALNFVLKKCNS